ncbi:MAG: aminoglycoside phosphotransferase family protein [Candidatus Binatia bacterium]|jgi:aminoglycoside phosphotransferase (APT) family kinase protein
MSQSLDPEIAIALDRAGLRARAFRRISQMRPGDARRSVYRIDLESGRVIKARLLPDEETARQLFEICRDLPDAFAPALGCYGAVLLGEWIDGEKLGDTLPSDAHLVAAGSLLARLHATPIVAGRPVHGRRSTAAWRDKTEAGLWQIIAADELDEQDALLIRGALERLDPGQAVFGLVHTDLCGENVVVDRAGRLHVVDNERVGIDALGFDVARSWYRWALPAPAWERLRSTYAARAPFTEPLDTFDFWSIVAVVHSAALRVQKDRTRAYVPLDRLRRMAADLGDRRAPCRERR